MSWPRLLSTATSTLTVMTSLRNVGRPAGTSGLSFLLYLDGIFCSASGVSLFLRGRATVSEDSFFGPCCATSAAATATNPARAILLGRVMSCPLNLTITDAFRSEGR